jgi:hypothetical protein
MAARCDLIDEILDSSTGRFSRINPDLINTRSNLNHETFQEICTVCGVRLSSPEIDATFLDIILLKRRNSIAHGEDTFIGPEELDDMTLRTISHMRAFKDAIENTAVLKTYRVA